MTFDADQVRRHAALLAGDAPVLLFSPDEHRYGPIGDLLPWVESLSGRGVYITMNETTGGRRRREDVVRIRAVWVDMDQPGPLRTDWPIEPSFIVPTSPKKYHYVWLTSHDNVDDFDAVMRGMPGDKAAKDAARVLRLAGTVNQKNGFVARLVACSGKHYTWAEIEAAFPPVRVERVSAPPSNPEPERADSALMAIPNTFDYDGWRDLLFAHKAAGGTLDALLAWTNEPAKERETRAIWHAAKTVGIGPGTLYKRAYECGWIDDPQVRAIVENVDLIGTEALSCISMSPAVAAAVEQRLGISLNNADGFEDLGPGRTPLQRDKAGRPLATIGNVLSALRDAEVCGRRIAFDDFLRAPMLSEGGAWRPVTDTDYTRIREHLERGGFRPVSKEMVRDALLQVAEEHRFDSAQQWLQGLTWDGVARVERALTTYFGAKDTPYHRAVSRYLFTALAGRVMQPGVKADMVPVAVGAQGARKSTTIRAIAPLDDTFAELDLGARDEDTGRQLRGKLVVELSELKGLRTRGSESLKAFLSAKADAWVPKYKEHEERNPRRVMFFGSSNRRDFLTDDTGHRRWLPFEVGECDSEAMARDRDQLWAEARVMFERGGVAYRDAEELAQQHHQEYVEADPWEPVVTKYVADKQSVTTSEVLGLAICKPTGQMTKADEMRIGGILTRVGWQRRRVMVAGQRLYRYHRPALPRLSPI